ncbi:MAG: DUF2341 domain-containing protein [Chitinispirillaceae bacterium]|nr:DUF2341 domain-containing protein [Chitinispirillaceae bacterium]
MNRQPTLILAAVILFVAILHTVSYGQAEDYSTWAHSRRLLLNTSSTGANVPGTINNFAVLVRLNSGTFRNFAQTLPDGADIRFSAADGTTPLAYHIERWVDVFPNNDTAEIWVSVPTISGDNYTQSIIMYWGKTGVASNSNGSAVFSLGNGYEAVWHLGDIPSDGNLSIYDATSGTANARPHGGMSINDRTRGQIGYSLEFGGHGNYLETTFNVPASERTLSAWIYPHSSDTTSFIETIIDNDVADEYGNGFGLADTTIKSLLDDKFLNTDQKVAIDQWQHVMVAFTQNKPDSQVVVYYNGLPVFSDTFTQGALTNNVYYIGRSAANADMFFHGRIDELRIDDDFKNADWAKLCYESQKTDQSLIPITPVLTWDTSTDPDVQIGDGTWGTDNYWSYNSTHTQLVPWLRQGHTALFDGDAGSYTITVNGRQVVDSISVQSGVELTFTGGGTIDFDSRSPIYIADGVTTVESAIAGSAGLSKYGSGTLLLSGSNTYTGATNVAAGTLTVNGTIASTGTVTVASGATLGGDGGIAGAVTAGGATIVPGNSSAGKLSLGALTLNGSSHIDIELGTTSDTIALAGALVLDGSVTVSPVAGFDAGTYRIFTCGSVTDNTLTVGPAPAGREYTFDAGTDYVDIVVATALLQSEPPDTELVAGQSLTLTADAAGEGTLSYLWQRSSSPANETVGSTADLDIAAVDSSYNGAQYRCIVTDSFGSDTSRWAVITVIDTPRITTQPHDTTVLQGEDAGFSVELLDTARCTYAWYKVGSTSVLGTGLSHSITTVDETDEGEYYCIITNPADVVSTDTVTLTVQPLPPAAKFDYSPYSGMVPLVVSFTDSSTGEITSREWDFGDGETDTAKNPTHTYTATGDFVVLLQVTGPGGTDITDTTYVVVGDSTPVARFEYEPESGAVPLEVTFTNFSTGVITSREWTFGDGESDTAADPTHTYTDTGTFAVLLAVEGPGGTDTTDTAYVTVTLPPPVAGFAYTPQSGIYPLVVEFTDTSTGIITSRKWTFGDGESDTAADPTHTYDVKGTYPVLLEVYGPGGADTTDTVYVTVNDSIPVASFDYSPKSGEFPLEVTFTDKSTGNVTSRKWTFGDGESDTVKNPIHTYNAKGKYAVLLEVYGSGSADTTDTVYVTVTGSDSAPAADFDFSPASGTAPLEVTFTDKSSGSISSYSWNFGDGETGTEANPKHTYTDSGVFTVTLAVTGPAGSDSVSVKNAITVSAGATGDTALQNALEMTSLSFDSAKAAISVSWCIDSAKFKDDLQVGIAYRTGKAPDVMTGTQTVTTITRCIDTIVKLSESLRFDTVYHVALFLREKGKAWPPSTAAAHDTVWIGAPHRQVVVFDGTSTTIDTITVFNDQVEIWEDSTYDNFDFTDTLEVYDFTLPESFILAGTPVRFIKAGRALPFYIGIRIRNLPATVPENAVRLYRDSAGVITVEHASFVDTAQGIVYIRTNDLGRPFIPMVDQQPPQVSFLREPDSVAHADKDLVDSLSFSDNIANVHWTYLYSRGDVVPAARDSGTFDDTVSDLKLVISSTSQTISSEYGVRALLVVSDGYNNDTVDLSRSVFRENSDMFNTSGDIWFPVYPTALLDEKDPGSLIISRINDDAEYDERFVRLFRWVETSDNSSNDDKWVEYKPFDKTTRALFSVVPGRLLWLKTRKNILMHLGNGRTFSPRDTFSMELASEEYTDFGMPFRFGVQIRDILAAGKHATDSVRIFSWTRDDETKRYALEPLYINTMADYQDTMATLAFSEQGGYSLYNPYGRTVVMRIPPTLPRNAPGGKKAAKRTAKDPTWGAKFLVSTAEGTALPAVYCGYAPNLKKSVFPPLPTFLPVRMYVVDRATGEKSAHFICEDAGEGLTKEIRIVNASDTLRKLFYTYETAGAFPETFSARLFDAATGRFSENGSMEIEANSAGSRWLVVGDSRYLDRFRATVTTFSYGLERIYPNPSRSVVNFRFTVGFNADETVLLTIFDLRGRKVWEKRISRLLSADKTHLITWDGCDLHRTPVGAGRYPVRLSFVSGSGKIVRQFDRVLTYLP